MRNLTNRQVQTLHSKVLYTNIAIESALDAVGLPAKTPADVEAAEKALEESGLAVCIKCGYWRDTSLMDGDDEDEG